MIDSYLSQCKQAGRELAIKEASLYFPLLAGGLGGSALAARAGMGARGFNRAIGKASAGILGAEAGSSMVMARDPVTWMSQAERLAMNLPAEARSLSETLPALAAAGAGGTAGVLAGGALIRAAERARRAARARSRPSFGIKPVDILTF